jgi:hypothetical protein
MVVHSTNFLTDIMLDALDQCMALFGLKIQ